MRYLYTSFIQPPCSGEQNTSGQSNNIPPIIAEFQGKLKVTFSTEAIKSLEELGVKFITKPSSSVEIIIPDDVNRTDIVNAPTSIDCKNYANLDITERDSTVQLQFTSNDGYHRRTIQFSRKSSDGRQAELEHSVGYNKIAEYINISIGNDVLETMRELGLKFSINITKNKTNEIHIQPQQYGRRIKCKKDGDIEWQKGNDYLLEDVKSIEATNDGPIKELRINIQNYKDTYTEILTTEQNNNYSR